MTAKKIPESYSASYCLLQKVQLSQLTMDGNVVVDHRSLNEFGEPESHENLQLRTLTFNRINGDISGSGPGSLRSVHLASQTSGMLSSNRVGTRPLTDNATEKRFLRVDFAEGISGNIDRKVMQFRRRVRSVYGAVESWQQELPLYDPKRLPPESITLGCEVLQVNVDPHAASPTGEQLAGKFGPVEFRATQNVEIEGTSDRGSRFQAEAVVASYNQAKDLFVLEGDKHRDAILRQQDSRSGQFGEVPARVIKYYRSEPRVELSEVRRPIDFQQDAPHNANAPQQPRR